MSISRRAVTARSLGVTAAAVAIALGAAGTAFACNAADFTPSVSCDQATGQAQITVAESATYGATVAVFTDSAEQNQVGTTQQITAVVDGTPKPAVVDVPWQTSGPWSIKVVATDGNNKQHTFKLPLAAPSGDCAAPAPSKSASPSTPASASPSASVSATATTKAPAPSASASASVSASTWAAASASASAAVSPSVSASAGTGLAETGGGSDSGMLLGIGAGLVVLGGGAVFVVRRRTAAGRH